MKSFNVVELTIFEKKGDGSFSVSFRFTQHSRNTLGENALDY